MYFGCGCDFKIFPPNLLFKRRPNQIMSMTWHFQRMFFTQRKKSPMFSRNDVSWFFLSKVRYDRKFAMPQAKMYISTVTPSIQQSRLLARTFQTSDNMKFYIKKIISTSWKTIILRFFGKDKELDFRNFFDSLKFIFYFSWEVST